MILIGGVVAFFLFRAAGEENAIAPEVFQSFNPLFIVSLTFVVMAAFAWLNQRERALHPEKDRDRMIIAALGFVVLIIGSMKLVSPVDLIEKNALGEIINTHPVPDSSRVMPYWLMSSYLILTFAELFLSPMGLFLCFQGGAGPVPGGHAGRLAAGHRRGQQAFVHRQFLLGAHSTVAIVDHFRGHLACCRLPSSSPSSNAWKKPRSNACDLLPVIGGCPLATYYFTS
ncbi:MAG: hypothetical protein R2751_18115 [Bacteroidales bacterium]